MKYDFSEIEKRWQAEWETLGIYNAKGNPSAGSEQAGKKWYSLFEFPYPSGDGLHVGHLRPYIGMDVISRKKRMEGYDVLFPIGWDAFGLPTENYAIKNGISPEVATKKNTDNFRRQFKSFGPSLDWSREIDTTDPNYYKWTQWMFLKFFEKGMAYKAKTYINWCPKDKIGLANEEAAGGVCDRCGGPVEKREKEQWMISITKYADKLLDGLKDVDYISQAKIQQENWIGRSEGAEIEFKLKGIVKSSDGKPLTIGVFTTRPDTIFGATYLVLAPEHDFIAGLIKGLFPLLNREEVITYVEAARKKSEDERNSADKEKTGVELKGIKAINPATNEEIPVYVADYVLTGYGTGAIMAVPQHDERDQAFAKKFNLPIVDKPLVSVDEVMQITGGKKTVKYKLRDWVFSRQRYWGEPIPLVYCEQCASMHNHRTIANEGERLNPGWFAVVDAALPVVLPKVEKYQPTDTGESPLANMTEWVNTTCPNCKGPAKRETDTMPNWAGSSWYFLRYTDPANMKEFASTEALKNWMPVDWYNGGMEHTVLHLLYSRFWNMFLYDCGLVPTSEPYKKRTSHGLILAEGGVKMSKSKGNVISPDDIIAEYGADALRTYEMFMGPFEQAIAWDKRGILGTVRFLEKVWNIATHTVDGESKAGNSSVATSERLSSPNNRTTDKELTALLHKTIKKVSADIEAMAFNTAISTLMIFINKCDEYRSIDSKTIWAPFLQLLAPFAPHMAEELWMKLGNTTSIHISNWPVADEKLLVEDTFELIIQVNGKMRDKVSAPIGISQADAEVLALGRDEVKKWISGTPKKVIFVENRLINFIV